MPIAFGVALGASLVSLVINRFVDLAITEIGHIVNVNETLSSLGTRAQTVQAKLDQLNHHMLQKRDIWEPWVRELTKLCYDVDDIIDDVKLTIIKRQRSNHRSFNPRRLIRRMFLHQQHSTERLLEDGGQELYDHPYITRESRGIILSRLLTWGLPHKISNLLRKLNQFEEHVDELLRAKQSKQHEISSSTDQVLRPRAPGKALPLPSGRLRDEEKIIERLLNGDTGVSIIGMAGLGKTTLARSIVDDPRIKNRFHVIRWISSPTRVISVGAYVLQRVKACDEPVKTLLVLDDLGELVVPNIMNWVKFRSRYVGPETTLLITTRDPRISFCTGTNPYHLKRMSDKDCEELIRRCMDDNLPRGLLSGYDRHFFNAKASCISRKCLGLPLMAAILGRTLCAQCCREGRPFKAISYFSQADLWELLREQFFLALRFKHPNLQLLGYFTLFPQDHMFSKDDLLQLWMAEGFIQPENWKNWEQAKQCFDNMLPMSMIEPSLSHPEERAQETYQINEITHRFSQSITSNMCFRIDNGISLPPSDTRHLSLCCQNMQKNLFLKVATHCKRLRTFLLLHKHRADVCEVPRTLFQTLSLLRVLDLSRFCIPTVPESIKNLKHLRYLDLSYTNIKILPESTCELVALKVLKLINCSKLKELPKRIGNLINLIHLELTETSLSSPPRRVGKLTKLQTLPAFSVRKQRGYRITELKHMKALQGSIKIMELENVKDWKEAAEAMLHEKPGLRSLELHWSSVVDSSVATDILTELQPHNNLEKLRVTNYSGLEFPRWFTTNPLCGLQSIHLHNVLNSNELPPFWKLPLLRALCLELICKVTIIGRQFFGDLNIADRFQWLESLEFRNMTELARFEELVAGDMPRLKELKFVDCDMLNEMCPLYHLTSLKELEIIRCEKLRDEPQIPEQANYSF